MNQMAHGAQNKTRALTNRYLDFWLLGGASIVAWATMGIATHYKEHWAIGSHLKDLAIVANALSLFVNNPHFLVSYKMAYGREKSFIYQYWWQLIVVPFILTGSFAIAYFNFDVPVASLPLLPGFSQTLSSWGMNMQFLSGPRLGDLIFTLMFNFMYLTVGWHYTKQTFGCMMVYANFDGYRLDNIQRNLIRWSLFGIWWLSFAYGNLYGGTSEFSSFKYYSLDLPDILLPLSQGFVFIGFVAILYKVFYLNYKKNKQTPSLNFLVPMAAMYIWWLPLTRQAEFYIYLTPLFHSLQYLAFVYKVEDSRLKHVHAHSQSYIHNYEVRATIGILGVVLAAWMAFEFVPNSLDTWLGTFNTWQMFFFFTAAMLFINIHHYFIDNVLWRFKNTDVKNYLLS